MTAHFAAVHLGRRAKLEIFAQHLLNAARRIYGVPEFRFYALADGIRQVLYSSRRGIGPPKPPAQLAAQPLPLPL